MSQGTLRSATVPPSAPRRDEGPRDALEARVQEWIRRSLLRAGGSPVRAGRRAAVFLAASRFLRQADDGELGARQSLAAEVRRARAAALDVLREAGLPRRRDAHVPRSPAARG